MLFTIVALILAGIAVILWSTSWLDTPGAALEGARLACGDAADENMVALTPDSVSIYHSG